ncbi:class I SAM-dependent methyltransferase [Phenylobacterium sp.]|uniref:class I SAM-dependent methyltransferase n=1 Tax=Phenylobacterium sp. TaxID=1871053 RepID=UPI0035B245CF
MGPPPRTLLILPGGFGDAPILREFAVDLGLRVVGASSLSNDPAAADYAEWARLPHIADAGFDAALDALVAERGIDAIAVTHDAVMHHLRSSGLCDRLRVFQGRTHADLNAEYRLLRERLRSAAMIPELDRASPPRPALSQAEAAGFIRAAMLIRGQSDETKLMALIEAARRAPSGDIVEIGSFFGRTAALFAMLAGRYDLGRVLCVDPWAAEEIDQGADALKSYSETHDWRYMRQIFEVNVAPFAAGRLNYFHGASTDAAKAYAADPVVRTDCFGETRYEGRAGLLYIDGNHEYGHVLADTEAWAPMVKPGGWIVFDDYVWHWGDGPRRVGEAFLAGNGDRVRCAFVAANALFVQLGEAGR